MMISRCEGRTNPDVFLTLPEIKHILIYLDFFGNICTKFLHSSAPMKDNRSNQ